MFVNDRLVFVELHKTGGTHIGKWLQRLVGGEQIGKHNRVPQHLRDRFIIGSVRNPWDWYVSLWAYGCAQKGSVHRQVTRRLDLPYVWRQLGPEMGRPRFSPSDAIRQIRADMKKPVADWRSTYSDATDADAFRRWLKMLMDPRRRFDMGEGYGFSPVSACAGILTYRYLKLFTSLDDALYRDASLGTNPGVLEAWKSTQLINFVIRNEMLEDDLLSALRQAGHEIPEPECEALLAAAARKSNASKRLSTSYYYDAETTALVAERESLVVETHGYRPPEPAPESLRGKATNASDRH